MKLIDSLGLQDKELVAFVGGGGKSSFMRALAEECQQRGYRVLVTTSTKMYRWQLEGQAPLVVEEESRKLLARIEGFMLERKVIAAGRGIAPDDKIVGLAEETIHSLQQSGLFDMVLVEADGAKGKPIKAPNEREPAVPALSTVVVVLIGMDALDCKLNEEGVHRPELFSKITGQPMGSFITETTLVKTSIYYARLIRCSVPEARIVVALNKVDNGVACQRARKIASSIVCNSEVNTVLLTSLLHTTPVREVIVR